MINKFQEQYMGKNYSEHLSEKITDKLLNDGNQNLLCNPSEKSVDFILNYSKSLSVVNSSGLDSIYLNLN